MTCRGFLAYDETKTGRRPGVLVVHEAFGLGLDELKVAARLALLEAAQGGAVDAGQLGQPALGNALLVADAPDLDAERCRRADSVVGRRGTGHGKAPPWAQHHRRPAGV